MPLSCNYLQLKQLTNICNNHCILILLLFLLYRHDIWLNLASRKTKVSIQRLLLWNRLCTFGVWLKVTPPWDQRWKSHMTCVKQSKETVTVLLVAKKNLFWDEDLFSPHSYFTHFYKFKTDNETGLNEALAKEGNLWIQRLECWRLWFATLYLNCLDCFLEMGVTTLPYT